LGNENRNPFVFFARRQFIRSECETSGYEHRAASRTRFLGSDPGEDNERRIGDLV